MNRRTAAVLAALAGLQLLVVGLAVAPRLSAHLTGAEYALRVEPVDPIDPFRGAYVHLSYAGLQPDPDFEGEPRADLPPTGQVFVPLVPDGGHWRAGGYAEERPADGPYLTCDSDGWRLSCSIESWFADQDEALRLESDLGDGAVATVRVDERGNAAIVGLAAG